MNMDKILADTRLIKTVKFYAERRDWHNLYNNLWCKGVLFHNDSPASIKKKVSENPQFQRSILKGQLQDILYLFNCNRLNDFPSEEYEALAMFFKEQLDNKALRLRSKEEPN